MPYRKLAQPVRSVAVTMNGITIAYVMGLVNALLGLMTSFGVTLTTEEQAYIVALVNASLILAVHVGHRVGEVTAVGATSTISSTATSEIVKAREKATASA